jgi:1,6-anhydro-N-acetylmuramate kinase
MVGGGLEGHDNAHAAPFSSPMPTRPQPQPSAAPELCIGLMSGTSLDGLDAVLVPFDAVANPAAPEGTGREHFNLTWVEGHADDCQRRGAIADAAVQRTLAGLPGNLPSVTGASRRCVLCGIYPP